MGYGLAVFSDTHTAMLASRALQAQFTVQVLPTPRQISAACGIAVRFDVAMLAEVRMVLESLCAATEFALYQTQDGQSFSKV